MFDHVEIKVVRFDSCQHFYATVLAPLLIELKWSDETAAGFGLMGRDHVGFLIEQGQQGASCHLAFRADDATQVDAFHHAGIKAGFACNGLPGLRPHYAPNYYAAFLRDPDGNNIEAPWHGERVKRRRAACQQEPGVFELGAGKLATNKGENHA